MCECVCHAVEQAQEQVSSLALFKKFKKQDEQSLWERAAELWKVKRVHCYLTSLDVVCQCIRVVMHVCCLFMRDAVFGYTLEKLTTLCWL